MRVSWHRRRHESLPPQRARSPKVLIILALLTTATVAFAAARSAGAPEPAAEERLDPATHGAEQASRDVVDERVRAHLRRLR